MLVSSAAAVLALTAVARQAPTPARVERPSKTAITEKRQTVPRDQGASEPAVKPSPDSSSKTTTAEPAPPAARLGEDGRLFLRPEAGETLKGLCRRVYGNPKLAPLLRRAGYEEPEERQPVGFPLARRVRLRRGESLSALARRETGRASRWRVLAAFSGISKPQNCAPGTAIVIPATLKVEAAKGDTLSRLAKAAWGERRAAGLLAAWNGWPKDHRLSEGEQVEIPLSGPFLEAPDSRRQEPAR